MGFIQGTLGGVSGGVSQQPDILRYPGQCTEQTNMQIDTVKGLRKRGSVELIKILDALLTTEDAFFHWFSIEDTNYVAVFTPTGIQVFDLAGTSYTTNVPNYSYITSGSFDSTKLSSAQVGEYNMIANANVTPAMSSTVDDAGDEYVTFHVSDGMAWGVRYLVKWNGNIVADYTAPDGSTVDATTTEGISSLYIAASLYTDINTYASPLGWTVILKDNVIMMKRPVASYQATGAAAQWTMEDSTGGSIGSCTIAKIQTLDELPPQSWPGHWVRVSGKNSSSLDDFYMTFETTDGTTATEGVWKESHNPTEIASFDEATMPHALIRVASGVFYFTPLDGSVYGGSIVDTWASRKAGDSDSNPVPSFIGKAIFDMTVIQQRLILVSEDHVNMSNTQAEFTFWSASALSDTDTDTIELTTPGERIAHLFAATEHEQNLIVLGNKKQFAVPLRNALTRANAALVPTTSYDVNSSCTPAAVGGGLYFAFSDGVRSGIREYRTGDVDTIQVADEVTAQTGTYIPSDLKMLVSDRQNNIVLAVPYSGNDVFMYQFLNQNDTRVMSAWSKMTFSKISPLSIASIDGYFYIIGQGTTGIGLYKLNKPDTVFLDYQVSGTVTSGQVDLSAWPFISDVTATDLVAVMTSGTYSGLQVQIESLASGVLTFKESTLFEGETVSVGLPFTARYTPTMPVLRDKDNKAIQVDRLTVNFLYVSVQDTGEFKVKLSAPYYDDTEQVFSGKILGSSFIVGEDVPTTRKEQISVGHNAREVDVTFESSEYRDLIIQALEYKGSYTARGMRI